MAYRSGHEIYLWGYLLMNDFLSQASSLSKASQSVFNLAQTMDQEGKIQAKCFQLSDTLWSMSLDKLDQAIQAGEFKESVLGKESS